MDSDEVKRLVRQIKERGHKVGYDPRTRDELDKAGIPGRGERALGPIEVWAPGEAQKDAVVACTIILPGQMLTRPDNKTAPCAWGCGRTVQFRPWVTLPTVCLYCCSERSTEDQ